jgi:hypothetical protein
MKYCVALLSLVLLLIASPVMAATTTLQSAVAATGNGTILNVSPYTSLGVQVTITNTAAVTFEITVDGSTWNAKLCTLASDGSTTTTPSASGFYQCNVSGATQFRARVSTWTSGTVTVIASATVNVFSGGTGSVGVAGWPVTSTTKEITWANSLANATRIGDGVTPICLYTDATLGPQVRPCTDADVKTIIPANFNWCLFDIEGASCMETVDPDAASTFAMWTYAAAYRPKATIWIGAGAMSTDGTNCAAPAEATPVASGAKLWTIICADNDSSRMHGSLVMPDSWDGGTLTFALTYVQTAADTNALKWQVAAQCKGDGEALVATASYGTEINVTDSNLSGSGKQDTATSAAVTPSGTCAASDFLAFYIDVDATGTTTAMATTHFTGVRIEYSKTSRSD